MSNEAITEYITDRTGKPVSVVWEDIHGWWAESGGYYTSHHLTRRGALWGLYTEVKPVYVLKEKNEN